MKRKEIKSALVKSLTIGIWAIAFVSCINSDFDDYVPKEEQKIDQTDLGISSSFDWKSITTVAIDVVVSDLLSNTISDVYLECYEQNPYTTNLQGETIFNPQNANKLYSAYTDKNGKTLMNFTIPTYCDTIYMVTRFAGLPKCIEIPISSPLISMKLFVGGGNSITKKSSSVGFSTFDYRTLGTWDKYGKPNYISKELEVITGSLLQRINNQFPEYVDITYSNPELLKSAQSITLKQPTQLYVTFLHEEMKYQNVFGYFCYNTTNPPKSIDEIKNMALIYPYVKSTNSANYLKTGEKIFLKYFNPETERFEDTFPKGVSIGWFLNVQGYSKNKVSQGEYQLFSLSHLNGETKEELKQHAMFFYDSETRKYILGFEEKKRDLDVCDNDFNDLLVFVSSPDGEVFEISTPLQIVEIDDSDGDGIPDNIDQMPANKERAFANSFPGKDVFGTLAFEDLWPYKGDYDFNDLVVDYNFVLISNANNDIVAIEMNFLLRAIGATYKNGFGIELPISWKLIESVSGNRITENYISTNGNGTETNQEKAVIIVFDNAFKILQHPGDGAGINTDINAPKAKNVEINMIVTLSEPINSGLIGEVPFNPFLIKDGNRSVEIHLPNGRPTMLADRSNFGLGHDDSDEAANRFYVANGSLPWAINTPRSFNYPIEKARIDNVYLRFIDWAKNNGKLYSDWYIDNSENINSALQYSK